MMPSSMVEEQKITVKMKIVKRRRKKGVREGILARMGTMWCWQLRRGYMPPGVGRGVGTMGAGAVSVCEQKQ